MGEAVSPEQQAFYQRLASIVGSENVMTDNQKIAPYEVDGFTPKATVLAATTEQVSQIIKAANESRTSLIPWGSGSKQQVGPCLSAADTVLCLKQMNKIVELAVSNFTVQVEAGMVNGELQKQLAKDKVFFPLDPLYNDTSTFGGEIAANANGPLRFKYGAARDLVLGVTVVTPTGDIVHTGGKTMKNVAGIDLGKLLVGSWGTLGVITKAVLRLFPIPKVSKSFLLTLPDFESAFQLVAQLLSSKLMPSSIELIDQVAGSNLGGAFGLSLAEGEVWLIINTEGGSDKVERHQKDIRTLAEANQARDIATLEDDEASRAWKAYRSVHQSILSATPSTIQGKASVPISRLGDMFKASKEVGSKHNVETGTMAHCGNGILYSYFAAKDDNEAFNIIGDLRRAARGLGGYYMVEAAPLWVRQKIDILPQRNDYTLMKRLKTEFDPNNILNPGRVVGGLY